jgi:hypothetical protein
MPTTTFPLNRFYFDGVWLVRNDSSGLLSLNLCGLPIEAMLAHCRLMGTKSRESIYGSSVRHSEERAAEARNVPLA